VYVRVCVWMWFLSGGSREKGSVEGVVSLTSTKLEYIAVNL